MRWKLWYSLLWHFARTRENFVKRFQQGIIKRCRLEASTGCWLWVAKQNGHGYGVFGYEDDTCERGVRLTVAHRVAYMAFKGPIPAGLVVRHKCHTPLCVNPAHLAVGTLKAGRHRTTPSAGEKNGNAKITPAHVNEIRAAYTKQNRNSPKTGPTLKEIAAKYGLGIGQVSRIVHGESW